MTDELFNYIIGRLISNADDTLEEEKENGLNDFIMGKKLAYYEVLDTIRNDLEIAEYDLEQCGLDFDIDKKYM